MSLRALTIAVVLGALVVFALMNWSAFMAPTTLSLGVATVEAPLGLILLAVVGLLTVLFLVYLVYLQSSVLMESRRHGRELQAQRELAEQSEASRLNQLREFLEVELKKLDAQGTSIRTEMSAKIEQLDRDLRAAVEQSGNTLAAYIGELDDRLGRAAEKGVSR